MNKNSSLKILFLLNLLYSKEYSKNEIIEEFKKQDVKIKKTSINNYINKLKSHNIPILTRQIKNKNYYSLEKFGLTGLKNSELETSRDVKKLVISEKNQDTIKKVMRIFYKFAIQTDDTSIRSELLDFGYYSKINWLLVKKLNEHCTSKDIITIDYIMPDNTNKYLTIHADALKIGDWSDRLYLSGVLQGDNKISQLPVDKIFMIKKIVKKCVKMNFKPDVLIYKISEDMYKKAGLDKKESLVELKNKIATIKRPLDDTFFTLQRLIYFCPELYYVSDIGLKNLLKEKLYALREMYNEKA